MLKTYRASKESLDKCPAGSGLAATQVTRKGAEDGRLEREGLGQAVKCQS